VKDLLNNILLISRHLLAILLMPFIIVVVAPNWLLNTFVKEDTRWDTGSLLVWLPRSAGMAIILLGFILFAWCVSLFARIGRGTLAPWDPPRNLVGVGPYRHVRNPMIRGVTLMVIGLALFWGSQVLGFWVCLFVFINHIYFVLSEEPGLERRFHERYRAYKENVPRWMPRIRPWLGK
jgi:protein-S-isoprenylcysteine O-methyltransferase Ste14